MANLNTNEQGGSFGMGGYFDPLEISFGKDRVSGEYLHVDTGKTMDYVIGVMMHELQHLINYYNNAMQGKAMDIWLN